MSKILTQIHHFLTDKLFFNLSEKDRKKFMNEITHTNLRRIQIFSAIIALYALFSTLVLDIPHLGGISEKEILHARNNLIIDIILFAVNLIFLIINLLFSPRKKNNLKPYHRLMVNCYNVFLLTICALNTVNDQLLHGQIIIYALAVMGFGLLSYFRLINALVNFIIPHAVFISGMLLVQTNPMLVTSNINNGNLVLVLGILVSRTFYFSRLSDFLQRLTIENQNKDLEKKSEKLEKLTGELQSKTLELELDREMLRKKNERMENEIEIARIIQSKMIPPDVPNDSIAAFYKPMEKVGGDFYDFILFPNKKKIGIFISDVSGHGIPAAFVTSMIKSMILQSSSEREQPSVLLARLNQSLFDQTAGQFITALYGILDMENRNFTFANAGHNLPYVIGKESIHTLPSANRSIPLGILPNQDITGNLHYFSDLTIRLEKDHKLFIYTDGLTETVSSLNLMEDFETYQLHQAFLNLGKLPPHQFVDKLVDNLIDFRGSSEFEDDICMICVDTKY